MASYGFPLRSEFDRHLQTFLVLVQCKRKLNLSREVTAADLVDLSRTAGLFREVAPLLRAELDELKGKLMLGWTQHASIQQTNPFLEITEKRKLEVITENQQTNPFLGPRETERKLEVITFVDKQQTKPCLEPTQKEQVATEEQQTNPFLEQFDGVQTVQALVVAKEKVQYSRPFTETVPKHQQTDAREDEGTKASIAVGIQVSEPDQKTAGIQSDQKKTVNAVVPKAEVQQIPDSKITSEVKFARSTNNSYQRGRQLPIASVPAKQNKSNVNQFLNNPCYYCGGKHALCRCGQFRRIRFANRLEFVEQMKLCSNCFSQRHLVSVCRDIPRCLRCPDMHHTLLHRFVRGGDVR